MEYLTDLILLFFFYSFLGWCIEVTLKYIQYRRFINRGFFTGPICPIYGSGAAAITLVIGGLSPFEWAYGTTFVLSFLLCGAIEYFTSYFMEKRFHARWWDYSRKPMNLHGRVWIGNLLLFGLGGVAIIHIVNPIFRSLLAPLSLNLREAMAGILLCVFAADFVITHFVLRLVKAGIERSEADNTEEIGREIRLLLSDRNIFYRRFADAYPEVIYRTERINARLEAIRAETEKLRKEAEQRRMQLASSIEPAFSIKNDILDKQDALIALLYDAQTATPDMKALKDEIDRDRERLKARPLSRIANHEIR
ncbi:MAG: putative ABC transporter permease [Clostridia bacterium]|nr:putative ABC transporter permease [Clostridia bacterium]